MNEKRKKESDLISRMWLTCCAAFLVYFSLWPDRFPFSWTGKVLGVLGTLMVLVLALIGSVSGEIRCLGIDREHGGKKRAVCLVRIFLAGLFVQILYAGYEIYFGRYSILTDSMVTAGIFCAAVNFSTLQITDI